MLSLLFALAVIGAYIYFNSHKAKMQPWPWVKANVMTTVVACIVVIGVAIVPKPVIQAISAWYVTPILVALCLKWGVVSLISNGFTFVSNWFKNR